MATANSSPPAATSSDGSLSELARQLRLLQTTNKCLETEIERLQRQLSIMSDLSGVSVADLRSSLEAACESEAHIELQRQVAHLKAQLEEEQLRVGKSADFSAEVEGHRVANFELRIGELQELHETDTAEISDLYDALQESNSESCRLSIQNEEQNKVINELNEKLRRSGQFCTDIVVADAQSGQSSRTGEVELLRRQIARSENQISLKEKQYGARFLMQDSRIHDYEQQLASLYAAFGIVEEERSAEKSSRIRLTQDLKSMDEKLAKSVDKMEHSRGSLESLTSTLPEDSSLSSSAASDFCLSSPPPYTTPTRPLLIPKLTDSTSSYSSRGSPAVGRTVESSVVLTGPVLKRGSFNRWKRRYGTVLKRFAYFMLQLSERPDNNRPSTYRIYMFRSKVERVQEFADRPYTLRITFDVADRNSPVLILSLDSEAAYSRWYSTLLHATTGDRGTASPTSFQPDFSPSTVDSDLEVALRASILSSADEGESRAKSAAVGTPPKEQSATSTPSDSMARKDPELEAALHASMLDSEVNA